MYANLKAADLVELIFDASTLEDAIFLREEMVERLEYALAMPESGLSSDERDLYVRAKERTEQAIKHLYAALGKKERWEWLPKSSAR